MKNKKALQFYLGFTSTNAYCVLARTFDYVDRRRRARCQNSCARTRASTRNACVRVVHAWRATQPRPNCMKWDAGHEVLRLRCGQGGFAGGALASRQHCTVLVRGQRAETKGFLPVPARFPPPLLLRSSGRDYKTVLLTKF